MVNPHPVGAAGCRERTSAVRPANKLIVGPLDRGCAGSCEVVTRGSEGGTHRAFAFNPPDWEGNEIRGHRRPLFLSTVTVLFHLLCMGHW